MRGKFMAAILVLAAIAAPVHAEFIFATHVLGGAVVQNQLWRFDSATPGTATILPITGTANAADAIIALDFRPATGQLYGLGVRDGGGGNFALTFYTIAPLTGVATLVSAAPVLVTNTLESFGMDFDAGDVIRVVTSARKNLRFSPVNGSLLATDTSLLFAGGDPSAGLPFVTAIASNAAGTLFGINSTSPNNVLVRVGGVGGAPSPNGGVVSTIGQFGVDPVADFNVGFDISPVTGVAYTMMQVAAFNLFTVNLTTGALSNVGVIGPGSGALEGLAVAPASFVVPPPVVLGPPLPIPALGGTALVLLAVMLLGVAWLRRPGRRSRQGGRA